MAKHNVKITDGKGSIRLVEGVYNVTASVPGYDNSTLTPTSVELRDDVETYTFSIAASGILTIHVSEEGTSGSTPVVGAKFVRANSDGSLVSQEAVTGDDGNAVFRNVPYSSTLKPKFYFKQLLGDDVHTFSEDLNSVEMNDENVVMEVQNPLAVNRNFVLTDTNFASIAIADGDLFIEKG